MSLSAVPLLGKMFGGADLAERNLGGSGRKKSQIIFEIFIPEIAANASNFKN